jgi:hypothetical protein
MKNHFMLITVLVLLSGYCLAAEDAATASAGFLDVGVGCVDITPDEPVILAGSPTRHLSSSIDTRLYVRALVLASAEQKIAIVALDTLKYPVDNVIRARRLIQQQTGIPANNVVICASHTHRGPLWSYYDDGLVTQISEAVSLAANDLQSCRIGVSSGKVEGVNENRRVVKEGATWNRWQLAPSEKDRYPSEGPSDPSVEVLAAVAEGGIYKAVVYNFSCHASNSRLPAISADYPGDVQKHVRQQLGYDVQTIFLPGACGDVNPVYGARKELFGDKLGSEILRCLGKLEIITKPSLAVESRELQMLGREDPQLKEADIALKWPSQLEHYKKTFRDMMQKAKPAYPFFLSGIRIGNDFAMVTNPDELFCDLGLSIKRQSTFKHTMVVEQTNGAHGYVPTAKAFEGGGYETWFGEHSYLSTRAGEIIETESLDILERLKATQ